MKRIEIFKAGSQTDNAGITRTFAEADLAATAAAYDPALHEAPIVVGHPKTDSPAFGWIARLSAHAGRLLAEPAQVSAAFAEQVREGAWKKVSAAFYPPEHPRNPKPGVWYLRHVGFLGAVPPAVKGLRAVEFSDADLADDAVVIDVEFSDADPQPHSQETAVSPEEAAALRAENDTLKASVAQLTAAQEAAARQARHAEHVAYAEKLAEAARIPTVAVPLVAALRDQLRPAGADLVEFGEGDAKQPLDAALTQFLDALPPRVEFGERATRAAAAAEQGADDVEYAENADPERVKLDREIRAYAAAHKVDYVTAARAVVRQ